MSNTNKILFVFEGAKTENMIVANLEKTYFGGKEIAFKCIFGAEIYQLYKTIKKDPELDLFNLLKERDPNNEIFKEYKRSDFAEIYLFFDYDGHSSMAADYKLSELIDLFSEETNFGKL